MGRRRFEHLVVELSIAVSAGVARYDLWLLLRELGSNPEHLTCEAVIAFHDFHLVDYLARHGLSIRPRAARRLRRALKRFDSRFPTPYEQMEHYDSRRV